MKQLIPPGLTIVCMLAASLAGCTTGKPASASQRLEIGRALASYNNAADITSAKNERATEFLFLRERCFVISKAYVGSSKAVCDYDLSDPRSQFASWPMEAILVRNKDRWEVVSNDSNQPWWWNLANHTIGVK